MSSASRSVHRLSKWDDKPDSSSVRHRLHRLHRRHRELKAGQVMIGKHQSKSAVVSEQEFQDAAKDSC
jgi:hypothetical protein